MRPAFRPSILALFALAACERDAATQGVDATRTAPSAAPQTALGRTERSGDAALVALRQHLDFGRLAESTALASQIAKAGDEAPALRARLAALSGKLLDALRGLETARAIAPANADLYATAAEIYAAADRKETAWAELERGEKACGLTPELLRAKGILWLSKEGGAARALGYLEEARRADPALPFCDRALAQAHLLAAKELARAKDWKAALADAQRSIEIDATDVDARRFLADARAANNDFDGAIAILDELAAGGEPLAGDLASLHKRAGMSALILHEREKALDHFAAARRHGLGDEELGTGARLLDEEASARLEQGIAAYGKSELEQAERSFRAALAYAPDATAAQNHLAVVLFQKKSFAEAIELWQQVIATSLKEGIELPEPVHINLAKAQYQHGDREGARKTLEAYLARVPEGPWSEETRGMLAQLDPK